MNSLAWYRHFNKKWRGQTSAMGPNFLFIYDDFSKCSILCISVEIKQEKK